MSKGGMIYRHFEDYMESCEERQVPALAMGDVDENSY
jgi:hypothetical protein